MFEYGSLQDACKGLFSRRELCFQASVGSREIERSFEERPQPSEKSGGGGEFAK